VTKLSWRLSIILIVAALLGSGGLVWYGWGLLFTPPVPQVEFSSGGLVLSIEEDGLYGINLTNLKQAGLSIPAEQWAADVVTLQSNGDAIPFHWQDETLIFYGRGTDSIYTRYRPYILTLVPAVESPHLDTKSVPPTTTGDTPSTVTQIIHAEENFVYKSTTRTDEYLDTWYWHEIHVQQKFSFTAELPELTDGSGRLTMHLYGTSQDRNLENDHDLDLIINDQPQTTIVWDGPIHYIAEQELPVNTLRTGSNTIVLDNTPEGTTFIDIMQFDWAEFTVPTPAIAPDTGQLQFIAQTQDITLGGFSDNSILVDVTNPDSPLRLIDWMRQDGLIHFNHTVGTNLIAAEISDLPLPAKVEIQQNTALLEANNQADLIVITTPELATAAEPLIIAREAQGLSATIATTTEIYHNFGAGEESPESIRTFLRYAAEQWQDPAPQYVLLIGTSVYDYREYLDQYPNQVPAPLVKVVHSGETVSDARLVDIDQDNKPDIAVGRWPVNSSQEVANLVSRTLAYEQGTAAPDTIFTADGTSSEFTGLADRLLEHSQLPTSNVEKLYGSPFTDVANAWNEGSWLVTYVGHGSINLWGKDEVFTRDAVSLLNQSEYAPPIVLQFTCLTGYFAHPTQRSISELMLTHEAGPVLLISATSLTYSHDQRFFAEQLLTAVQNTDQLRMGDALQSAKGDLDVQTNGSREVSDTFGLLGDPSALIIRP